MSRSGSRQTSSSIDSSGFQSEKEDIREHGESPRSPRTISGRAPPSDAFLIQCVLSHGLFPSLYRSDTFSTLKKRIWFWIVFVTNRLQIFETSSETKFLPSNISIRILLPQLPSV